MVKRIHALVQGNKGYATRLWDDNEMIPEEAVEQMKQRSVWLTRTSHVRRIFVIKYQPTSIVQFFDKHACAVEVRKVPIVVWPPIYDSRLPLRTFIMSSPCHMQHATASFERIINYKYFTLCVRKLEFTRFWKMMPCLIFMLQRGKNRWSSSSSNLLFFFFSWNVWDVILLMSGHECRRRQNTHIPTTWNKYKTSYTRTHQPRPPDTTKSRLSCIRKQVNRPERYFRDFLLRIPNDASKTYACKSFTEYIWSRFGVRVENCRCTIQIIPLCKPASQTLLDDYLFFFFVMRKTRRRQQDQSDERTYE